MKLGIRTGQILRPRNNSFLKADPLYLRIWIGGPSNRDLLLIFGILRPLFPNSSIVEIQKSYTSNWDIWLLSVRILNGNFTKQDGCCTNTGPDFKWNPEGMAWILNWTYEYQSSLVIEFPDFNGAGFFVTPRYKVQEKKSNESESKRKSNSNTNSNQA